MSFGFLSINTGGTVQIDENFINHQVWSSGTVSAVQESYGNNFFYQNFSIGPFPESCTVYLRDHNFSGILFSLDTYVWAGSTYCDYSSLYYGSKPGVVFDYIVTVPSDSITISDAGAYGLIVKNASNKTVFNSNINTVSVIASGSSSLGSSLSLPYSTRYRYFNSSACGGTGTYSTDDGAAGDGYSYIYQMHYCVMMTSNNTFSIAQYNVNTGAVTNTFGSQYFPNPGSSSLNIGEY